MRNQEDYIYISRNIVNDAVWDFHRTPKGTGGVFIFIAELFHDKDEVVDMDMSKLNFMKKPSANKEFINSFKWLVSNGYIKCQSSTDQKIIRISLTDKSTKFVKFHLEDCYD